MKLFDELLLVLDLVHQEPKSAPLTTIISGEEKSVTPLKDIFFLHHFFHYFFSPCTGVQGEKNF